MNKIEQLIERYRIAILIGTACVILIALFVNLK